MSRRLRERRRRAVKRHDSTFGEINITPFTDVLLVLLIIFLIAGSTLAPSGLKIDELRPTAPGESRGEEEPTVRIWVSPEGALTIRQGDLETDWNQLSPEQEIVLQAHPRTSIGEVVKVYDRLLREGFTRARLGSALELE